MSPRAMPAPRPAGRRLRAGFSLVEVMVAAAILAAAMMVAVAMVTGSVRQLNLAKQREIARLAASAAREALATVKFRADTSADTSQSLFVGGYAIGRTVTPTAAVFNMPDVRTATLKSIAAYNGLSIAGCVAVEFPVPPLDDKSNALPAGRTYAGRVIFFVNEHAFPTGTAINRAQAEQAFPFPSSANMVGCPSVTALDCDGDGQLNTTDLRTKTSDQTNPYRLIPTKIEIDWKSEGAGTFEHYEETFLLCYEHP